jgi:hypothetical protein
MAMNRPREPAAQSTRPRSFERELAARELEAAAWVAEVSSSEREFAKELLGSLAKPMDGSAIVQEASAARKRLDGGGPEMHSDPSPVMKSTSAITGSVRPWARARHPIRKSRRPSLSQGRSRALATAVRMAGPWRLRATTRPSGPISQMAGTACTS